jgi:hypothetical protein
MSDSASRPFRSEQKLAKEAKGGPELGFWDASHGPASPSGGSSTSARSFTKGSEADFEQKLAKEAKGTKGRSSGVAGVQE